MCAVLLAVVAMAMPLPSAATVEDPGDSIGSFGNTKILILHSAHQGYGWTDSIIRGIRETLEEALSGADLFIEYLDTKRNRSALYFDDLYGLYQRKLAGREFDVLITTDNKTLEFALDHRATLFPGVPIVFSGVSGFSPAMLRGEKGITGVIEVHDYRATLDIAFKLWPHAEQIVFISPGLANRQLAEPLTADYRPPITMEYWTDDDSDVIEARATTLPRDAIVVPLGEPWTASGQAVPFDVFVSRISKLSRAPIFATWDFALGHGVVGGRMVSGKAQGEVAAALALRILQGEAADDIPVVTESPNRFLFDYEMLQQFRIPERRLPKGSVIVNKPRSYYDLHKEVLWSAAAICLALTAFIAVLLASIRTRKRAETALRQSETRFRDFAEAASDWFWELDENLKYTYVSKRFGKVMGLASEQVLGKTLDEVPHSPVNRAQPRWRKYLTRLANHQDYRDFIYVWSGADDRQRVIRSSGRAIFLDSGAFCGYRGASTDVTGHIGAENRARRARDLLIQRQREEKRLVEAELGKVRDELVRQTQLAAIGQVAASIGHDLRNPLGAIRNATYYLQRRGPEGNEKWAQYLQIIDQEVVSADRIISELMEMSRTAEPTKEPVDLGSIVRGSHRRIGDNAAVTLRCSFAKDPYVVYADATQLSRVLDNLITNAMQATDGSGEITVKAWPENGTDLISVVDNGPGVAVGMRDRLFEPLVTSKAKGTGLGLAICRQLIERHGGSINFVEGHRLGAEFRISLPRGSGMAGAQGDRESS